MGKVFKVYFSHWTIWVYIFLALKLAFLLLLTKSFSSLGTCFILLIFSQNLNWAVSFSPSITIYFLFYEWVHPAHNIDEYRPKTQWGRRLKKAHKWHHFKNENYWWGITSAFGDHILKTFPEPQDISKSETVLNLEKRFKEENAFS